MSTNENTEPKDFDPEPVSRWSLFNPFHKKADRVSMYGMGWWFIIHGPIYHMSQEQTRGMTGWPSFWISLKYGLAGLGIWLVSWSLIYTIWIVWRGEYGTNEKEAEKDCEAGEVVSEQENGMNMGELTGLVDNEIGTWANLSEQESNEATRKGVLLQ